MNFQHKNIAAGRWQKMSLVEQLGNIGSEISRAARWQEKDKKLFENAVERALELFDLTLDDPRWRRRLREISRVRELFCNIVFGGNTYKTSLKDLNRYFYYFAFVSRLH